jgi:hypothetical protein
MKSVGTKLDVWKGNAEKTTGGLKKSDLKQGKDGSIVSRDKSTVEKKNPWIKATQKAYKQLVEDGTIKKGDAVLLNQGVKGKEWYERSKSIYGK